MEKKVFEKIELPGVKHILIIASGKGGVGKSTIAANLSVALAREGYRTALVDADLYGPSIPTMFGIEKEKLKSVTIDGKQIIVPYTKFGVKLVSIGFFLDTHQSLIWRGPMVSNAISQLINETNWGYIDFMVIDFPPGTGDIQLTTVQKLPVSGALIVTTPQKVAVSDARKAADMFVSPHIGIPLLGIVENMAWFSPKQHPDEKYYLFGKGGGQKLADEFSVPLLGQIPFTLDIGEASDQGLTIYNQSDPVTMDAFNAIVNSITQKFKES